MKVLGLILVVLGLLGFVLGGITFTQEEQVAELGPLEIKQQTERTIPIGPLASGAAVAAGLVLVVVGSRKRSE